MVSSTYYNKDREFPEFLKEFQEFKKKNMNMKIIFSRIHVFIYYSRHSKILR